MSQRMGTIYYGITDKKLLDSFALHGVPADFAGTLERYLVRGMPPGGFISSLLANDGRSAIMRCHPANQIVELKPVVTWIQDYVPEQARDSYANIQAWCLLSDEDRKTILQDAGVIMTLMEVLKADHRDTPARLMGW